jgi:hypothetical protein
MNGGIFKIVNRKTGWHYIGKAVDLTIRKGEQESRQNRGSHRRIRGLGSPRNQDCASSASRATGNATTG